MGSKKYNTTVTPLKEKLFCNIKYFILVRRKKRVAENIYLNENYLYSAIYNFNGNGFQFYFFFNLNTWT